MKTSLHRAALLLPLLGLFAGQAFAVCNGTPTCVTDVYNMAKNTTLSIYFFDLASNDTDPEDDPLSAYVTGAPSSGSYCGINPSGVCYQPPTNFTGLVAIPQETTDGCSADAGTILIFVQ